MSPWETLVREHLPVVTGVALRILGDRSAAEDVAQDLFLHLLQNPHALDGAQNVRSFLCRSAINRSLDRLREKERRNRREAACPQAPRDANPLDAAFHDEIRRSVEALPQDERDAIAARFFRGLTVREAAKEMRVSVGTVCNRLEAGVKRLRKWLGAASFALLCMVFDDEAVAEAGAGGLEKVLSRGGQSGAGSRGSGGTAGKGGKGKWAAAGAGIAAMLLISIWLGRPGEIAGNDGLATEMARLRSAAGAEPRDSRRNLELARSGPIDVLQVEEAHPRGPLFRVEGFLLRREDGYQLIEPSRDDPVKVEGPVAEELARVLNAEVGYGLVSSDVEQSFSRHVRTGVASFRHGDAQNATRNLISALDLPVGQSQLLRLDSMLDRRDANSMLEAGGDIRSALLRLMDRRKDALVKRHEADGRPLPTNSVTQLTAARPLIFQSCPILDALGAGNSDSFRAWLQGASDERQVPHFRVTLRAAWVDQDKAIAEAVEIEEIETLNTDWLVAWRHALNANAKLAKSFDIPPGARRRAEAMAALDDLESALGLARDARQGESAAAWRIRRESEIEIASSGAAACLGHDEGFPEDVGELSDPEDFAASRAVGLELEIVPQIQRGALALRGGARIVSVVPGSVADRAGLRAGDIVWRVTPLAGAGRSAAHDVVRPEDVAAFVADVVENGGSGLEFEVVRGLDSIAFELKL